MQLAVTSGRAGKVLRVVTCTLTVDRESLGCKVALARCALDPLAVLASLCGRSGEILGANLHPLQDVLPKQELLAVAERICITAANQVSIWPCTDVRGKTCKHCYKSSMIGQQPCLSHFFLAGMKHTYLEEHI